jgi:hypothetical protein
MELAVLHAVFVHEPGDFDIVTAVFGDLHQFSLAVPLDRLQAFGGFRHSESGRRDGIQGESML